MSRAKAIVIATTHYNDPKILAEVSEQVTGTMKGLAAAAIEESHFLQTRGWYPGLSQPIILGIGF